MIIVEQESQLRCITQTDHAQLSAELLGLWILNGLPDHPRRDALLFAVREHDNGWREADAAPRTNPRDSHPYDFRNHPDELRLEIWQRCVQRLSVTHSYATALIAAHCLRLHHTLRDRPNWKGFLADLEANQEKLLELSDLSLKQLEVDYGWLALGDTLSLAVCDAWSRRTEQHGMKFEMGQENLEIEPFSFAGTTTFAVPCRYVPNQEYSSDLVFATTLAEARWEKYYFRVRPRQPTS
ncbi:MAG: DUF3891 family protein [Thermoanaerobaculia bacterium]